jgi:hypothetical protein
MKRLKNSRVEAEQPSLQFSEAEQSSEEAFWPGLPGAVANQAMFVINRGKSPGWRVNCARNRAGGSGCFADYFGFANSTPDLALASDTPEATPSLSTALSDRQVWST